MYGRIIEKLRKLSKYDAGLYLRFLHRIFKQRRLYKKFPDDREFLEKKYLAETGRCLNLDNPERFTEKIQWMKVFHRNPLMTRCADKLAVREYVKSKGCGNLLNELIAVYDSAEAFDPAELPDRFVVKATHGSSMNLICKDKNTVNWKLKKEYLSSG